MSRILVVLAMIGCCCLVTGCKRGTDEEGAGDGGAGFSLTTKAFRAGGDIDLEFTCDARPNEGTPAMSFGNKPKEAKSLALVMEDRLPTGTVTHWLVCNLPRAVVTWPAVRTRGVVKGKNDFGKLGYKGPCPPQTAKEPHVYYFIGYALDSELSLKQGFTREEFDAALAKVNVLGKAEMTGSYMRAAVHDPGPRR